MERRRRPRKQTTAWCKKKRLTEATERTIVLYHGTCEDSAKELVKNGWKPGSGMTGGNQGQTSLLYVTNEPENAEWFAHEKGCDVVLKIAVPLSHLIVDPEDGIGETVEEELALSKRQGTPASLAVSKPIPVGMINEEKIGKAKGKGVPTYFQMGSSLPDKLYNQKDDGTATRDPGVLNMKKESKEEGSPSKPSRRDLEDAIEHASFEMGDIFDEKLFRVTLSDFNLSYLGELSIAQLEEYDDLSSWMDDIEDEEDLIAFRGPKWAARAVFWKESVPPVVVVTSDIPPYSSISDGRGRVTYANYKKLLVPTWQLNWKGTVKGEKLKDDSMKKESKETPSVSSTTSYFKVGDEVLFGKYKNKKGKVVGFGEDDKGNPTIEIEPVPKGKKKNVTLGLYRMWLASIKEK